MCYRLKPYTTRKTKKNVSLKFEFFSRANWSVAEGGQFRRGVYSYVIYSPVQREMRQKKKFRTKKETVHPFVLDDVGLFDETGSSKYTSNEV